MNGNEFEILTKKLEKLTDKEKENLLETIVDDSARALIISTFSNDTLKLKYVSILPENERWQVIMSLQEIENKIKAIDVLTEEQEVFVCIMNLPNAYKIRQLKRLKNLSYKLRFLKFLFNDEHLDLNDILDAVEEVEDERDRALLIAQLGDLDTKKAYIDKLKNINNKSIIVMALDDDDLKLEYIKKVEDEVTKVFLIASLKNRKKVFDNSKNEYKNMTIPDDMTVGIEIESEGEKFVDIYIIANFFSGWNTKEEWSIGEGVEVVSPILNNSPKNVEDIYCICQALQKSGQKISDKCGGHIHIGSDYLKTKEAYVNLIELWANNEDIMYLICNDTGEIPRDGVIDFAKPISKILLEAIKYNKFKDFDKLSKDEFIEKIKEVQAGEKNGDSRRTTGINFLNIGEQQKNTIEFRLPNGTINPNTWIENVNLFGNIIVFSQKLSDIQNKNESERTDEEKVILEKFAKLKTKETSQDDRMQILLDLCIPQELRDVYVMRYKENRSILSQSQNSKNKTELDNYMSSETVEFLTEESVRKIARESEVVEEKYNAKKQFDYLEKQHGVVMNQDEKNE